MLLKQKGFFIFKTFFPIENFAGRVQLVESGQ